MIILSPFGEPFSLELFHRGVKPTHWRKHFLRSRLGRSALPMRRPCAAPSALFEAANWRRGAPGHRQQTLRSHLRAASSQITSAADAPRQKCRQSCGGAGAACWHCKVRAVLLRRAARRGDCAGAAARRPRDTVGGGGFLLGWTARNGHHDRVGSVWRYWADGGSIIRVRAAAGECRTAPRL